MTEYINFGEFNINDVKYSVRYSCKDKAELSFNEYIYKNVSKTLTTVIVMNMYFGKSDNYSIIMGLFLILCPVLIFSYSITYFNLFKDKIIYSSNENISRMITTIFFTMIYYGKFDINSISLSFLSYCFGERLFISLVTVVSMNYLYTNYDVFNNLSYLSYPLFSLFVISEILQFCNLK